MALWQTFLSILFAIFFQVLVVSTGRGRFKRSLLLILSFAPAINPTFMVNTLLNLVCWCFMVFTGLLTDLSHSNEPSTSIIRGAPAAVNLVEHGGPESLATYSLRETSKKFLVGEFVRIKRISDSELTRLTEAVAAWNPLILTCRNEIGYIHKTTISSNAVRVQFRRSLGRW